MRRFRILATLTGSTDHDEFAPDDLRPAMEAQLQRDEADDERHRALHYRKTWPFQCERDPLPVRVDLPAMPSARLDYDLSQSPGVVERLMRNATEKRRTA